MNLVGKIFVVVIFVLCLVFMALTMAVYTAQRNWREVVMLEQAGPGKELGLKYQLDRAKKENENLNDVKTKLEKEYATEKAAKQQALSKLQAELAIAKKDRISLEAGRADLEKDMRDKVAAMSATQKNATDFRLELDKQRTDLLQAQKDRDKHFGRVVELTDLLNQAVNDKEQLRKRTVELAKDVKKADEALQWHGFPDKNSDYKSKTPPKVDAIVTSVNGDGLIEISLGSDAGLREGHQLDIYRTNGGQVAYVGRVKVVKTDPSKSVCKVDPNFQNSNIMVNDRVASKID